MSDLESPSSLSDFLQNLELSSYSTSLMQEEPGEHHNSQLFSSDIQTSPQQLKYRQSSHHTGSGRTAEAMVRQRDNVIDSIRLQSRHQIEALQEKLIGTLTTIESLKNSFKEKLEQINKSHSDELNRCRQEQEEEISNLKNINRARRENLDFSKLPVLTDDEYPIIKAEKPSKLTIPQYVALQLYEHDLEKNKQIREANRLKDEALKTLEQNTLQMSDRSIDLMSERELRLSLESRLATMVGHSSPEDHASFGSHSERVVRLERENAELRASCSKALNQCNEAQTARAVSEKKLKKSEDEILRLTREKESLQAHIAQITSISNKHEDMINDYKLEVAELRKTCESLYHSSIQTSEVRKLDIGSIVSSEIQRLSERHRTDLDFIVTVSEKKHESEVKILKDAHDKALEEIKQLRIELRQTHNEHAKLQAEYLTLQKAHECEIMRLQSDVRSSHYECERVKLTLDELKASFEDVTDERDALAAKFDIVKQELMKKEADMSVKDSHIISLQEKVNMYEKLEGELDHAIENLDLHSAGSLTVPVDANRRVKQNILLSKRVLQLTNQNSASESEINKLREEVSSKNTIIEKLTEQIEAAGKPQQVFVSMLSEKQDEINKLRRKIADLTQQNNALKLEKESMKRDVKIVAQYEDEKRQSNKISDCPFANFDDEPIHMPAEPAPFIISSKD